MADRDDREAAKKRIMFVAGEDFNFLTYNVLIILDALGCNSQQKMFHDHRKLPYLISLASSPTAQQILLRRKRLNSSLGKRDLHTIASIYTQGVSRRHLVERVIYVLSRRGLVTARVGTESGSLDVCENNERIPEDFQESEFFELERANLNALRRIAPKLRSLKLGTFLQRYFTDQGVQTWQV